MIWHSTQLMDVMKELDTNPEQGLTAEQAAEKLRYYGQNSIKARQKEPPIRHLVARLTDPWSVVLILAVVLSIVVSLITKSGFTWEPVLILSVLVINAALTTLVKRQAEQELNTLDAGINTKVTVLRGGKKMRVDSITLVPGDIVLLEQGELIPADGRIIECIGFSCDEAAITGENVPCEKDAAVLLEDITPLNERLNMVYMNATVLHGSAVYAVTDTGLATEYGKLVVMARQTVGDELPIKKRLDRLCKTVGFVSVLAGLLLFIFSFIFVAQAGVTFAQALTSRLMLAVSFIVAVLPESISVIVTVTVALGILRMARQRAVLKNISKIETIAAVSLICADKTGTMTQNKMRLECIYDGVATAQLKTEKPSDNMKTLLQMGALCCEASVELTSSGKQLVQGDATESAIVGACLNYCNMTKSQLENTYPRMYTVPFDSERQLMTTINMINNRYYAIVKGSPDKLFACCTSGNLEAAEKLVESFSEKALRVIAVGMKPLEELAANPTAETMECNLALLGVFGLGDQIRTNTVEALAECDKAGIRTVVMTGDNLTTASAAGKQLGILKNGLTAVTGEDISAMSEEDLRACVAQTGVYSRLDAEARTRVVQAYHDRGEVVAITGDEIRDSKAIKAADIGLAMGIKGTDAAKSSADVVLTDDSFSAVVHTIQESRVILYNIKRAVLFLFGGNLGELLLMLLGIVIFKMPPLTALGLLWINLITDCVPAIALGTLPPDRFTMRQKMPKKGRYFGVDFSITLVIQGVLIATVSLIAFGIGRGVADHVAITMALVTVGLAQLFQAVNTFAEKPLLVTRPRVQYFMLGALFIALLQLILSAFTPLCVLFGGTVLTISQAFICLGLSSVVFVGTELYKTVVHVKSKY